MQQSLAFTRVTRHKNNSKAPANASTWKILWRGGGFAGNWLWQAENYPQTSRCYGEHFECVSLSLSLSLSFCLAFLLSVLLSYFLFCFLDLLLQTFHLEQRAQCQKCHAQSGNWTPDVSVTDEHLTHWATRTFWNQQLQNRPMWWIPNKASMQ